MFCTQNKRSNVNEGNSGGILSSVKEGNSGGILSSIIEEEENVSTKNEGNDSEGRINHVHNPTGVDQNRRNSVFCPPNPATAMRFVETFFYEQCDPIVRMIAPTT